MDGRTAARPGSRGSVPLSHPRATYAPAATAPLLIEQGAAAYFASARTLSPADSGPD